MSYVRRRERQLYTSVWWPTTYGASRPADICPITLLCVIPVCLNYYAHTCMHNSELYGTRMNPCLSFFGNGTTPVFWAVSSRPGWMPTFISLVSNWPVLWAAFRLSRAAVEFLFVAMTLCSELFFGRLRELLLSSYRHRLMLWATFQPSWVGVELLQ